jgi:hypothetical protein
MTLHSSRPDARTDLVHGTLDMLILRTLQWGPQHGYAIGQTIRAQSSDVLQVEAGFGDPLAGIELEREVPERVGQEIGHAWLPPAEGVHGAKPMSNDTDPLDVEATKAKLEALKSEHRDLDEVIDRLIEKAPFDQLQLQRLKKRKLGLKDQITKLESKLIPDIIA